MTKRRTLYWCLLIGFFIIIIDTFLYFSLYYIGTKKKIFYANTLITNEKIEGWLENNYHPILGWDLAINLRNNFGARRSKDYPQKSLYKMKIVGDSFTMGAEVSTKQTFASVIEQKTEWECINFGVGAYGPDQALLKYEIKNINTEYTMLGILCENIGRVVSRYPAFYMREWIPPKPRFIRNNGNFVLIENPIRTPDDLRQLMDENFTETLKINDYWVNYYENVLGAPAKLEWPAIYTLINHLPFFYQGFTIGLGKYINTSYESESKLYKIPSFI